MKILAQFFLFIATAYSFMQFNSLEYALFLPIVFGLYWLVFPQHLKRQNLLIVAASYIFYACWDLRFLFLIAFTSFCSWQSGLLIEKAQRKDNTSTSGKSILICNLVINLLILGFFKYYHFFVDSFIDLLRLFGIHQQASSLKIILPVGISFYTFQALSYSIDVYRRKISATKDIVAFFAFVSFFPQLVAGPIERAKQLLPQFEQARRFQPELAVDGLRQILWGLFKKVIVADHCALFVNEIFDNYSQEPGSRLLLAAIFFAFQIYGDFSGYSDIAIGSAKLFGIKLMRNFKLPYFSRDVAEFWRRWHISLNTWFVDYLYIPLGGSRPEISLSCKHPQCCRQAKIIRNTLIVFLCSGLWHGANWSFVAWGAYHAILFIPLIITGKNKRFSQDIAQGKLFPSLKECRQMLTCFALVVLGWIFFRAESIQEAFTYIGRMLQMESLRAFYLFFTWERVRQTSMAILLMLVLEWFSRHQEHPLCLPQIKHRGFRWLIYLLFILALFAFQVEEEIQFIYFQF